MSLLAGASGLLDGYFVSLPLALQRQALILAALVFVIRGRNCHFLVADEQTLAAAQQQLATLCGALGITLTGAAATAAEDSSGDGSTAEGLSAEGGGQSSAVLVLSTAQQLMAEFVASAPFREADFHQKVIASRFGSRIPGRAFNPVDVVLVDQADQLLLDVFLRPLTLSRPRELPDFDHVLQVVSEWARTLDASDFEVRESKAVYCGEQPLTGFEALSQLPGYWRSERVLGELVGHALTAWYGLKRGQDYQVADDALQLLNPETGEPVPGKAFPEWTRQFLEAKESLAVTPVSEVVQRKSYQVFFRERTHLAGCGTALELNRRDLALLFESDVLNLSRPLALDPEKSASGPETQVLNKAHLARKPHSVQKPFLVQIYRNMAKTYRVQFFDPAALADVLEPSGTLWPDSAVLFSFDPDLQATLAELTAARKGSPGAFRLAAGVQALIAGLASGEWQTADLVLIGSSVLGREERLLENWLSHQGVREPIRRMLPRTRRIGLWLPEKLQVGFYRFSIAGKQQRQRAELLSEQVRILKSEYGLRDQWI